jgi:hypothetical protein
MADHHASEKAHTLRVITRGPDDNGRPAAENLQRLEACCRRDFAAKSAYVASMMRSNGWSDTAIQHMVRVPRAYRPVHVYCFTHWPRWALLQPW